MTVEAMTVEWDEGGLMLAVVEDGTTRELRVPDPEQFYKEVRYAIEPWLREAKDARRERRRERQQVIRAGAVFHNAPDDNEDADGGIMRQEIADLNRHAREDAIREEAMKEAT
jgi:hypothetical protein